MNNNFNKSRSGTGTKEWSDESYNIQPGCHEKWEKGPRKERMKMHNYKRKMEYLKIHDPEKYRAYKILEDEIYDKSFCGTAHAILN